MRAVYRYEVPVDDQAHWIQLRGPVLSVGCRRIGVVEFWAEFDTDNPHYFRSFQVYGTGGPDVQGEYVGTAIAPGGQLVWHLYQWEGR